MKFTLNRDFVLVTKEGPSYGFRKGAPVHVQQRHAHLAISIGAEPDADSVERAAEIKADIERDAAADRVRVDKIKAAIQKMVERNSAGDFTAGGKPNRRRVENLVGDQVSDNEVALAFQEVKHAAQPGA